MSRRNITKEQMIGTCPDCGADWKHQSYFDAYREQLPVDEVSDEDILRHLEWNNYPTHISKLLEISDVTNTFSVHLCPYCLNVFDLLTD